MAKTLVLGAVLASASASLSAQAATYAMSSQMTEGSVVTETVEIAEVADYVRPDSTKPGWEKKKRPIVPGTTGIRKQLLEKAMKWWLTPYQLPPTKFPKTIDCSLFTQEAHKDVGVKIPRNSNVQWEKAPIKTTKHTAAKPGDIVFFPGHVGLVWDREGSVMLHASSSKGITFGSWTIKYWQQRGIRGVGTYLPKSAFTAEELAEYEEDYTPEEETLSMALLKRATWAKDEVAAFAAKPFYIFMNKKIAEGRVEDLEFADSEEEQEYVEAAAAYEGDLSAVDIMGEYNLHVEERF